MELFYDLYLACLTGTVIFSAVSVGLFIKLDIRTAWRVLKKKERKKERKTDSSKKKQKKTKNRQRITGTEQGTVLLHSEKKDFCVEREILVVHTDEFIKSEI